MSGLWFEQLEVGLRVQHATTRTVTETDNVLFTTMTMNPQPLHLDAEFAARSQYGQILVNSMFTVALVIGLAVPELTLGTTVANLGFSRVDFPAPVFIGDPGVCNQLLAPESELSSPVTVPTKARKFNSPLPDTASTSWCTNHKPTRNPNLHPSLAI